MVTVLRDNAFSCSMVKILQAEYKRDRESLEDNHIPGRPVTITTQDSIGKFNDFVLKDRRLTEHCIATE